MTHSVQVPPTEDRCEAVLMVQTKPNYYTPVRCVGRTVADCRCTTEQDGKPLVVSLCEGHALLIGLFEMAR